MKIKNKKKTIVLFFIIAFFISILIIYFLNNRDTLNKFLGKGPKQSETEQSIEYKIYKYTNNEGKMLIKFQDNENGIEKIKYPNDGNELICNGKNIVSIEYPIEKDKNYEFKMYTTTEKEIISNITINDEFLYENGIKYEEKKAGTGYRIIDLKYLQDMDATYKNYYKVGENGEWKEYKDSLILIDYNIVKDNLINTKDNTVTLYAKSINDTKQEVILSKKYDVDINSKGAGICTVEDLQNIKYNMAGSYKLMNDIDLAGEAWMNIGETNYFTGTLDGNGYVIKNMTSATTDTERGSLFYRLRNATIKNIGFENISVKSQNTSAIGGTAYNCRISNVYSTGTASGSYSSGIISYPEEGTIIENCYSTVECTGYACGGIASQTNGSKAYINNCYSNAYIKYDSIYKGGGIINPHWAYNDTVTKSYYNKDLTTTSPELSGVTGCTTEQMKKQLTYEGWDFDNVWYMDTETGFPKLRVFKKD